MADVYRDGFVHVRAEPCDRCLFSKDRLVSGARAREIITDTRSKEAASFICHKHQVSDEPAAICGAWFDAFADEDPVLRLAIAMDVIKRILERSTP